MKNCTWVPIFFVPKYVSLNSIFLQFLEAPLYYFSTCTAVDGGGNITPTVQISRLRLKEGKQNLKVTGGSSTAYLRGSQCGITRAVPNHYATLPVLPPALSSPELRLQLARFFLKSMF